MPIDQLPSKVPPAAASAEDVREALVPVQMRVRGNQIVGLVDHMGNELGMPLTAIKSDGEIAFDITGRAAARRAVSGDAAMRLAQATVLHDFSSLAGLTVGGTGATVEMSTDPYSGEPCVKFTAGTSGTSTLDIQVSPQAFAGINPDGTDYDGLLLQFYLPNENTSTSLNIYASNSDTFAAANWANRVVPYYDSKFNNASPAVSGYGGMYLRKSDINAGTPGIFTDPTKQLRCVRIAQLAANSGPIYLRRLAWNTRPKNQVLLTFDDASDSVFNVAKPIMDRYGLRGTVYYCGSLAGTAGYLTIAQLKALDAAGWDIANHTYSHLNASAYADAAGVRNYMADVARNEQWLTSNGFTRARKHFAYPNGECVPGVHDVAFRKAGYLTARVINSTGLNNQHHFGVPNPHSLTAKGILSTTMAADMIAIMENSNGGVLGAYGRTSIYYLHGIGDGDGSNYWYKTDRFESLCADIAARQGAGTVTHRTITEWADYAGLR